MEIDNPMNDAPLYKQSYETEVRQRQAKEQEAIEKRNARQAVKGGR